MIPINPTYLFAAPGYLPVGPQQQQSLFDPYSALYGTAIVAPQQLAPLPPYALYSNDNLVNYNSYLTAERKIDEKIRSQIEKFQSEEFKKLELERKYEELRAAKVAASAVNNSLRFNESCCQPSLNSKHVLPVCNYGCSVSVPPPPSQQHHNHHHHYAQNNHHHFDSVAPPLPPPKPASCNDCCSDVSLHNIEEKIKRIRDELALPPERCESVTPYCSHNAKYKINERQQDNRQPRSRSKSSCGHDHNFQCSKSRSPSASHSKTNNNKKLEQPLWKPTGLNDYSWAKQLRSEIISGDYKSSDAKQSKAQMTKNNVKVNDILTKISKAEIKNEVQWTPIDDTIVKLATMNVDTNSVVRRPKTKGAHKTQHSRWSYAAKNDYTWANTAVNQLRDGSFVPTPTQYHSSSTSPKQTVSFGPKPDVLPSTSDYYTNYDARVYSCDQPARVTAPPPPPQRPKSTQPQTNNRYVMHAVEKTKKGSLYSSNTGDCLHYIPDNADINKLDVGSSLKVLNSNCVIIHE